ncbi:acyl-CoA dehydrogenase family protein [Staphylospora marina]|uniref:acyl-CoA dehydrogenase family protein n=1 Tax=Staphylospora marina TaxID=2490858 RepID=UPI000F5BE584|nr:acyl-CoA dehydrogenase family protein [Staphylospora marina]
MFDYSRFRDATELNWYESDWTMRHYVERDLAPLREWGEKRLLDLGAYCAGPMNRRAAHTDRDGAPVLVRYDREGREVNEIRYNEGYLATVGDCYETGVVGWRYREDAPQKIPFFYTQMMFYLMSQAEVGFTCPVTLTMAVAFVLEKFGSEEQKRKYLPRLASMDRNTLMQGATLLTEIQGGSDVGAVSTCAVKEGNRWLLTGEKWFASNCDAGVSVILARTGDIPGTKGLSLFLMPRELENGEKNRISIRRLKDKLGVRAVPSGELILNGAEAELVGEENQGFRYMAEALNISRLCTATGSLALSRRAFLEAAVYASRRHAFGRPITDYPMVRQTLLDMITDIEANWALAAEMIRRFDTVHTEGKETDAETLRLRLWLALAKYRCSEDAVSHTRAALELHGGNGYIEDFVTPRLLRDAQVNTVWEGTSNIMGLEVVKLLAKEAAARPDGGCLLLEDAERCLAAVTLPDLERAKDIVSREIPKIREHVHRVVRADSLTQNACARKLADELADVCRAVRLLDEAQHAANTRGTHRLAKLADYFVRRTWRPEEFGIGSGTLPSMELFDSAVRFEGETFGEPVRQENRK